MVTTRGVTVAVAALLSLTWLAGQVRADDDSALQKRALALNDITGEDPINGEIKTLVSDAAGTKKLLEVAVRMAKEKEQPFNYNAALILGQAADKLKELDSARAFYRVCISQAIKLLSGQKLAQAYDHLITLLERQKKYEEAIKVCQEFLELPDEGANLAPVRKLKNSVLVAMIQLLAQRGDTDKAYKLVDRLLADQPDNWYVLDLKGRVQRQAGQYQEAAKTYEDVLEKVKKDKLEQEDKDKILREYRHVLSGIYVDLDQVDKAAEVLKGLLAEKPDNPTYNNDLGYIWADHDKNLKESEQLIRKALDEERKQRKQDADLQPEDDKDNAAFLDSLGWVLYKQKNYKEAKKYLLQASQDEEGQHIEILDHLGDVHLALNEKAEAVAVWKKAITLEASGKREKEKKTEIEKKIKANE